MKARIIVTLKRGVLDPQGKAVKGALTNLGFDQVKDVRVGKVIDVDLDGVEDEAQARTLVEDMCKKLLANPVIEDFSYTLEER
ncbi:MAG TPA: phosphoribosylformylglycinamidine synthase subunit PurS [Thermosulfidibacter takaii]|uniref:Phosphoribosylformylglycinamidine synthase subunit PurS n=1 Tax=Thermosulfidibacter takaii TaxID=412593 RepID=A0A7C0Y768_9BACT|nr:phosphoribosylformylglycinamidine synthase subunit PurS [Thermosulfidibacter takaii]